MAIMVRCQCGKQLRARDTSAGKRVKCSACGGPVRVPASQYDDDYGVQDDDDDKYGANPYADAPPRRGNSKQKPKSKAKKSAGGSKLPLMIVGGAIAGVLVIGGIVFSVLKSDGGAADDVAAADGMAADAAAAEGMADPAANANDSGEAAAELAPAVALDSEAQLAAAQAQVAAAEAQMKQAQAESQAAMEKIQEDYQAKVAEANRKFAEQTGAVSAAAATPASTEAPETTWVVLSNFKQQGNAGIAVTLSVDYRVVGGQPDPSRTYVLFVGSSMGMMTRYQEVELNLANASGIVAVPVNATFQKPTARVAWRRGRNDWEPVSGDIEIGGAPTAAQRPLTVLEAAGADAQGKLLALANARFENSRTGSQALVVDFVMQTPLDSGFQYLMVITGQGEPLRTRVTSSLIRAAVGKTDQIGVQPLGAPFPAGDLKVHIEKVISPFSRDAPEIVSNTVSVRR